MSETRTRSNMEPFGSIRDYHLRSVTDVARCVVDPTKTFKETLESENLITKSKVMTDVVTPGFRSLMKQGHIINNNMEKVERFYTATPYVLDGRWVFDQVFLDSDHPSDFWSNEGYLIGSLFPGFVGIHCDTYHGADWVVPDDNGNYRPAITVETPACDAVAEADRCIAKAFARVANAPMNAWVTIAEARETIDTIRILLHAARAVFGGGIREALARRGIRKGGRHWRQKLKLLLNTSKFASEVWLLCRYGIRPIVYDIISALEVLRKLDNKSRQRFSSDELTVTVQAMGESCEAFYHEWHWMVENLTKREVTHHAGVLVRPAFENYNFLTLMGFGEYVKAAWDLVPFSFVVDWFANVGDVLASWSPDVTIHPLASWLVRRDVVTNTVRNTVGGDSWVEVDWRDKTPSYSSFTISNGSLSSVTVTETRIANPALPVMPHLDVELGVAQVLDLLALARSFKSLLMEGLYRVVR